MGDRPASPARADNGKLSTLPQLHRFITGHNPSGQAIVHSHNDFLWKPYDADQLAFSVAYTTSEFPPDLNDNKDVESHHATIASDNLGLVNPRGTVLRCVDFAPGYACGMHRTQSLDYGIVIEGEWARMMFVLQDCKPLVVGGEVYGEDLGTNSGLPPSGN
ncbi:hypothetical protein B0T14DRAFT_250897 [Immersiella caudata]|uniref:Uncharacterized protein n=1 Tax=Immersiella caudata TaxID=314043 RepID=A0AA40BWU5_9PEZI|nr:hypothetical protein B0T14DRAFT_250897 [Immersiella caudata]